MAKYGSFNSPTFNYNFNNKQTDKGSAVTSNTSILLCPLYTEFSAINVSVLLGKSSESI